MDHRINSLIQKYLKSEAISLEIISIVDDQSLIDTIYQLATQKIIRARQYSLDEEETAIVVIALTIIAINHYDNAYWEHVERELSTLFSGDFGSTQAISHTIRQILKIALKEKVKMLNIRLIYLPLMEGIITRHTYEDFIQLMYDVFALNFSFQFNPTEEDIKQQLSIIYKGLRQNIEIQTGQEKTTTDVLIGSTKKTYVLSAYTQAAIYHQHRYQDQLDQLTVITLNQIHQWYWNMPITKTNTFLDEGFARWITKQQSKKQALSDLDKKDQIELKLKPVFRLTPNFELFIHPKTMTIERESFSIQTSISIYNQNNLLFKNNRFKAKDIIGGFEISADKIEIDNPFSTLQYIVETPEGKLYDSDDKLHRKILFFDVNGRELSSNRDYVGVILIVAPSINHPAIHLLKTTQSYSVGQYDLIAGEGLLLDGVFYSFMTAIKPGITGERCEDATASFKSEVLNVYRQIHYIAIDEMISEDQLDIFLDGKNINDQLQIEKIPYGSKIITKLTFPELESDIHHLFGKLRKDITHLFDFKFVIDAKFKLHWHPQLPQGLLSSSFEEQPQDLKMFDLNPLTSIDIKTKRGSAIKYHLRYHYLLYRINNEWRNIDRILQKEEITPSTFLSIYSIKPIQSLRVKNDKNHILIPESKLEVSDSFFYQINLGFIKGLPQNIDTFHVEFIHQQIVVNTLRYIDRNVIDETKSDIQFIDNKLTITIQGYGNKQMLVQVSDQSVIVHQEVILFEKTLTLSKLKPFIRYKVTVLESNTLFQRHKDLLSKTVQYYDQKGIVSRQFRITMTSYPVYNSSYQLIKRTKDYIMNPVPQLYLYFIREISRDYYEGYLATKNSSGKWLSYLKTKVLISIEEFGQERGMYTYICDEAGDELLIDPQSNQIIKQGIAKLASPIERIYIEF
jgi:SHS2 domain-containing protein